MYVIIDPVTHMNVQRDIRYL